ncbi:RsiV family protein [Moraxella bovis]|uniref:RsiV family protein n=1 Tax=Moraxella bovis TaxID=476 RepID=UPI002225EB08|nr:RsiV family protein [Moraxella bovis]UYZ67661.1 RsiV family protein [Moraxella bovis]UYZ70034.1 RsiV family protein [Moraxella bovis]UYZ74054.1 RsiV family protein [Moraxella bovis]UZA13325.1 RsiV family protein [Moraxella bovis]UZA28321.1 RsiV family protein [Moraxella bovis]
MKKILVLALAVLMTACGQDETVKNNQVEYLDAQKSQVMPANEPMTATETLKAIDSSLAKVSGQDGKKVSFAIQKLDYTPPKDVTNNCVSELPENWDENTIQCPSVDMTMAKIEPRWINDIMRREMTGDDNPELVKFRRDLDDFVRSQIQDEISLGYSWSITPKYLGMHNQVAQFAVMHDTYLGGAHGMAVMNYYLFDMDLQSQITLADIQVFDSERGTELFDLMGDAYQSYLKGHEMSKEEIAGHMETYPLDVSEDFYFGKDGLVFSYAPYHLGPYAMGTVELVIAYDKLQGIIREEYLPKQTAKTANQKTVSQESASKETAGQKTE